MDPHLPDPMDLPQEVSDSDHDSDDDSGGEEEDDGEEWIDLYSSEEEGMNVEVDPTPLIPLEEDEGNIADPSPRYNDVVEMEDSYHSDDSDGLPWPSAPSRK